VIGFLVFIAGGLVLQAVAEFSRGQPQSALEVFRQRPTAANLRAYEHGLEEASLVGRALRPLFQFAQFVWLRDGGEKALVGHDGWLFYRPGCQDMLAGAGMPGATNDPVTAIVAWRDALAGRGIHLLVVPVPNKESIYPDRLSRRVAPGQSITAPTTQEVLRRLRLAGVECVDLFELFARARKQAGAPLYLAQDSHWSPAGLEVAAQAVARRLVEQGWIERGNAVYHETSVPVRRLGDVLGMLQAPQIESCFTPETVPCVQVLSSESARPYQDAPDSELLVVGDSFLRIYQRDEPGAAGFIAHLAKALHRPLASIVNDGGASTLVRQELYRRPALLKNKRVVVWEFVERDLRLGTEGWQQVPLPQRGTDADKPVRGN
jgi:hypothetical protein